MPFPFRFLVTISGANVLAFGWWSRRYLHPLIAFESVSGVSGRRPWAREKPRGQLGVETKCRDSEGLLGNVTEGGWEGGGVMRMWLVS